MLDDEGKDEFQLGYEDALAHRACFYPYRPTVAPQRYREDYRRGYRAGLTQVEPLLRASLLATLTEE